MISRYIEEGRRAASISLVSSIGLLGFGLGPVIGGSLTQWFGWHSLFLVTCSICLLLPWLRKRLPKEPVKTVRFDFVGALSITLAITGILLFITAHFIIPLVVGVLSVVFTWLWIHRHPVPFVTPDIIKNRGFLYWTMLGFFAYTVQFATLFVLPLLLIAHYHANALHSGLLIFPGALLSAIAGRYLGRVITQFGQTKTVFGGLSCVSLSTLGLGTFAGHFSVNILVCYLFMGIGVSAVMSGSAVATVASLHPDQVGAGMGLAQLIQLFGGAFGVASAAAAISWQQQSPVGVTYSHVFLGMAGLSLIGLCMMFLARVGKGRLIQ